MWEQIKGKHIYMEALGDVGLFGWRIMMMTAHSTVSSRKDPLASTTHGRPSNMVELEGMQVFTIC